MSMFPKPTPNRPYCRKHGIEYSGYICPECAQELRKKAELKKSASIQNANNEEKELNEYRPPVLCPKCLEKSLFYNQNEDAFECLNVKCKVQGKTVKEIEDKVKSSLYDKTEQERLIFNKKEGERQNNIRQTEPNSKKNKSDTPESLASKPVIATNTAGAKGGVKGSGGNKTKQPIPRWMIPLLLIFALSFVGVGISIFVGTTIPFWILFGFGCIFSLEKWFSHDTRKHKGVGKLYRFLLNLSILLLLGLLIWTGIKLFSQQFLQSSLAGSLVFLAELVLFIWMWKVVAKNSWRWPSMKLTVFTLVCLGMIFAFAGVQPMTSYKDRTASFFASISSSSSEPVTSSTTPTTPLVTKPPSITQHATAVPTILSIKPPVPFTSPIAPVINDIIPGNTSNINTSAFQTIDQYALGTPESVTKSIDALASYLVQPATNDLEKTRAIYRWVTQNISYDFSAYLSGRYGSTKAADVLTSRSSICEGYSGLFNALAKSAGLEVVTISGWAKGYSYNAGDKITGPTNHAWNAVKINGGWYLIDSTWGAGSIVQQKFVRDFDEAYFLTPPEQFIYNHLPEDSKWQLLNPPYTKSQFAALPYVYSSFFSYGLGLGNNTQCIISANSNLNMIFPVPNDVYLMAQLSQNNIDLADSLTSAHKSGNQYQINATFPKTGDYVLSIYARKGDEFGTYQGVLEYKVVVNSIP